MPRSANCWTKHVHLPPRLPHLSCPPGRAFHQLVWASFGATDKEGTSKDVNHLNQINNTIHADPNSQHTPYPNHYHTVDQQYQPLCRRGNNWEKIVRSGQVMANFFEHSHASPVLPLFYPHHRKSALPPPSVSQETMTTTTSLRHLWPRVWISIRPAGRGRGWDDDSPAPCRHVAR